MSKSLGNGVDPVDIANRMGGEIVRLWVASVDFREDMAASENLMQRCAELYKKLRNTFRFLLGNLNGFDPARDQVAESRAAAARPLHAGAHARSHRKDSRLVRGLRVPSRLPGSERVRHRGPELVLSRRAQRPHVHVRAHEPGSAAPRKQFFGRSPKRLSGWSRRSSASPPTKSGNTCQPSKAARVSVHLALFPKPEEIFSEDPCARSARKMEACSSRPQRSSQRHRSMERQDSSNIGKSLEAQMRNRRRDAGCGYPEASTSQRPQRVLNVSEVKL